VKSLGLNIAGGLSILTNGFSVVGGLTVNDFGVVVPNDGSLNVNGSLYTNQLSSTPMNANIYGGLTVGDFGLTATGGMSVGSGGLNLPNAVGATVYSGGVTVTGGATINTNGLFVSGGILVRGGVQVTGGLTIGGVSPFGTNVIVDSLQIPSGGLVVNSTFSTGGDFIISGNVVVKGKTIVNVGPFSALNGMVIEAGGLSIVNSGMKIHNQFNPHTIIINSGGLVVDSSNCYPDYFPSSETHGNCVVYSPNENAWGSTEVIFSDKRLKVDVEDLEESLTKIKSLRGVYFSWRDDPAEERHVGVIAQEIQSVLPAVVEVAHKDGHLGVKYLELLPLMIEAVKELTRKIDESEEQNRSHSDVNVDLFSQQSDNCTCANMELELQELSAAVKVLESQEIVLLSLLAELEGTDFTF